MKLTRFRISALAVAALAGILTLGVELRAGALSTSIRAGVNGVQTTALARGTAQFPYSLSADIALTDGTASGQSDRLFSDTRTLTASSSENLDLAGTLTDAYGSVLTFAKVKAIIIKASATNTNNVVIGGAASNGFVGPFGTSTDTIQIKPGGVFMIAHPGTGWTVTAGTGDLLKVLNGSSGTSVSYDVVIIGTSV